MRVRASYTQAMRSAEIRERFLSFFEERGHRRMASASLVPASFDPTVLLTTAGMQPFKPYFRGEEQPPSPRLTSCQKVFRSTDIENVGLTARHLTFFEMLGNFSVGDYFKQGAAEFAWEFSREQLGFEEHRIWITVFGGDEELGVGPDEEAIECWRAIGVSEDRIVRLGMEAEDVRADALGLVDGGRRLPRRYGGGGPITLPATGVAVVVTAEADDRRPPHPRRLAGRPAHQRQQGVGVAPPDPRGHPLQVGRHIGVHTGHCAASAEPSPPPTAASGGGVLRRRRVLGRGANIAPRSTVVELTVITNGRLPV